MPIGSEITAEKPIVSSDVDTWGTKLNNYLQAIEDAVEAQVPISAVDFNGDVDVNSQVLINTEAVRLENLSATRSGVSNVGEVYEVNGDLYYNNSSGVAIQITTGSSIVSGGGGFTGLTSPALAQYTSGSELFELFSNTSTTKYGKLSIGGLRLFEFSTGVSNYVELIVPTTSSSVTFTLPNTVPASDEVLIMDSSGVIDHTNSANVTLGTVATTKVTETTEKSEYFSVAGPGPTLNLISNRVEDILTAPETAIIPISIPNGHVITAIKLDVDIIGTPTRTTSLLYSAYDDPTGTAASTKYAMGSTISALGLSLTVDNDTEAGLRLVTSITSGSQVVYGARITHRKA